MICIDDPKAALQIVELAQHEFPQAKILVRSYDRGHAVDLIRAGVDYQIRETVESAYLMGAEGLRALGYAELDVEEAAEDIRRRDNRAAVRAGPGRRHVRHGSPASPARSRAAGRCGSEIAEEPVR